MLYCKECEIEYVDNDVDSCIFCSSELREEFSIEVDSESQSNGTNRISDYLDPGVDWDCIYCGEINTRYRMDGLPQCEKCNRFKNAPKASGRSLPAVSTAYKHLPNIGYELIGGPKDGSRARLNIGSSEARFISDPKKPGSRLAAGQAWEYVYQIPFAGSSKLFYVFAAKVKK